MSTQTLHILNGDFTLEKFRSAGFTDQFLVWRETLALGPLFYQLDSELFWEMRSQFMEKAYGVKLAEYRRKVIMEFAKLRKFAGREIVLWYEYDVFCQVNFMALLSYILKNKKGLNVSIVCVGDFPGSSKRMGLGEIQDSEYQPLFENRISLKKQDLMIADKAWMYWCGKMVDRFSEIESKKLPYLRDALEASKVLLSKSGDLSELEIRLRSMLQEGKFTKREMIRNLLINDETLGFGDLQYEYLISFLQSRGFTSFSK